MDGDNQEDKNKENDIENGGNPSNDDDLQGNRESGDRSVDPASRELDNSATPALGLGGKNSKVHDEEIANKS